MKNNSSLELTDLRNVELVTLAVYLLGGAERALDTEDIAVRAHELGPGRFSWKKYPDQINLELVRVYLSGAKKATHSTLISGTGKSGWRLTQNGLEFARKAETQASVSGFETKANAVLLGVDWGEPMASGEGTDHRQQSLGNLASWQSRDIGN